MLENSGTLTDYFMISFKSLLRITLEWQGNQGKKCKEIILKKESRHYAMFDNFCKEGKWIMLGKNVLNNPVRAVRQPSHG